MNAARGASAIISSRQTFNNDLKVTKWKRRNLQKNLTLITLMRFFWNWSEIEKQILEHLGLNELIKTKIVEWLIQITFIWLWFRQNHCWVRRKEGFEFLFLCIFPSRLPSSLNFVQPKSLTLFPSLLFYPPSHSLLSMPIFFFPFFFPLSFCFLYSVSFNSSSLQPPSLCTYLHSPFLADTYQQNSSLFVLFS